jgi:hydrogenase maturation protein HypF
MDSRHRYPFLNLTRSGPSEPVARLVRGAPRPSRRSRNWAPAPLRLPVKCARPTLAVGGRHKSVFALGNGHSAFLSHRLGDLDHAAAFMAFLDAVVHYEKQLGIRPERLVHDLSPDYASTVYAYERAEREGVELIGVQHQHAHLASAMADNGLSGRVLGVVFDGTGLGIDGRIWGGEFLVGGYAGFERAGHLRYVPMPGDEPAARDAWRLGAAHLSDAGEGLELVERRRTSDEAAVVRRLLSSSSPGPLASSCGRLFDAAAAILGVSDRMEGEGQTVSELETLALQAEPDGAYPFELRDGSPLVVDTRPLIRALAADARGGVDAPIAARRFHSTIVELAAAVCRRLRPEGVHDVVLSGGSFGNSILAAEAPLRLERDGWRVHVHRSVPSNDGGLAFGQLAVAAARP